MRGGTWPQKLAKTRNLRRNTKNENTQNRHDGTKCQRQNARRNKASTKIRMKTAVETLYKRFPHDENGLQPNSARHKMIRNRIEPKIPRGNTLNAFRQRKYN